MCHDQPMATRVAGALMSSIERDFGSFDNFRTHMSTVTVAIQGSGWGWLVSVTFCIGN